ncbi:hypothetical protein EON81_22745 [bacterium]|nr:MAG: hypothetical protein EON81_22745 [bacterium]
MPKVAEEDKVPETTSDSVVHVGKGQGTNTEPNGGKSIWDIKWQDADIDPKTRVLTGQNLSGTIYQNGKPVADYVGGTGGADNSKKLIVLSRNVQVKSKSENGMTLYCDELKYEGTQGKDGRIRAKGNVRVVSKEGSINFASEVYATPDLKQIGLPEVFGKL